MAQTVLIVDDDPQLMHVVAMFFELEGFHVLRARDGKEALDVLAEYLPDVVLLDVMMPEVNGLEVCRQIKQDDRLKVVPVIVFTAAEHDEAELRGAGADRFISKPYSLEGLRDTVQEVLQESVSARPK